MESLVPTRHVPTHPSPHTVGLKPEALHFDAGTGGGGVLN